MENKSFDNVSWLLGDPITNFCMSIVDDSVRENANLHYEAGLSPKIIRTTDGKCCKWCDSLAGVYDYDKVRNTGNDVFKRHRNCGCLVEYDPGDGRRQNAHTKQWRIIDNYEELLEKESRLTGEALERKLLNNDINFVEDAQNWKELEKKVQDSLGMTIDPQVKNLDFVSVREGMSGVEYIYEEFPQASEAFKKFAVHKDGIMSAGYGGDVCFNPGYFATRKAALDIHIQSAGIHPKGLSIFGSGAHEAGHLLEKALIDKGHGEDWILGKMLWDNKHYAKAVVNDAVKNVKKTPLGKGKRKAQLMNEISFYAGEKSNYNPSECLAEAVSDFAMNGEDAAPLSKEIWKILKKELG